MVQKRRRGKRSRTSRVSRVQKRSRVSRRGNRSRTSRVSRRGKRVRTSRVQKRSRTSRKKGGSSAVWGMFSSLWKNSPTPPPHAADWKEGDILESVRPDEKGKKVRFASWGGRAEASSIAGVWRHFQAYPHAPEERNYTRGYSTADYIKAS